MRIQKINNQTAFGIRFTVKSEVYSDFTKDIENYLKPQKFGEGGYNTRLSDIKQFFADMMESLIGHNLTKENHKVYPQIMKIEKISVSPESNSGLEKYNIHLHEVDYPDKKMQVTLAQSERAKAGETIQKKIIALKKNPENIEETIADLAKRVHNYHNQTEY